MISNMATRSSSTQSSNSSSATSFPVTKLRRKRREWLTGYLFILPSFLVIGVFGLFPIGFAVYMSLHRWRVRKGAFVGFENYERLLGNVWGGFIFLGGLLLIMVAHWLWVDAFASAKRFRLARFLGSIGLIAAGISMVVGWTFMLAGGGRETTTFLNSIVRTVFYALGSIPIQILLSLAIASLLHQKIKGQEFFRMIYFLPYVMPVVATSVIFRSILANAKQVLLISSWQH